MNLWQGSWARWAWACVLGAGGCAVFDPALYQQRQRGDGGAGTGADGSVPVLALADRCSGATPPAVVPGDYSVTTVGLADDYSDFAACVGHALPGADGFVSVTMQAGELWHFHVKVTDGTSDPAVYVLPTCDERACQQAQSLDECGAGRDEHLTVVATRAQTFLVGVDSRVAGAGARYQLTVAHPVCGNGIREHSEACEPTDTIPGGRCDARCHGELSTDLAQEVEPNDDFTDATMINVGGAAGVLNVRGRLGGRCDFDMYGLTVPQGGSVRATMSDVSGNPCTAAAPPFTMTLAASDGRAVLGTGTSGVAGNACPAIASGTTFAQGLGAGTYYLRVTTARDQPDTFDYRIRLEVAGP